jgi:hypothetical protein
MGAFFRRTTRAGTLRRPIHHRLQIGDLTATARQGRPSALLEEGQPLTELF